jgi:nucleotidyltransferase substrate binding protein (TIGR01987 family)
MALDLSSLEKAVNSLNRALVRAVAAPEDEELRDACIQRFEYTFELSWKTLKRQLEEEVASPAEVDSYSFKQLFRVGGERGLVLDVAAWFNYREKRNLTSHVYDEAKAREVYAVISNFAESAASLLTRLKERNVD